MSRSYTSSPSSASMACRGTALLYRDNVFIVMEILHAAYNEIEKFASIVYREGGRS
jgi:hypothetical protein